ncbi:MAG: hypothetical protein UIB40_01110, partial [Paludibacteraceae bacterium]|nr:hypothetical protein [Paludibacteraceae bacterium]
MKKILYVLCLLMAVVSCRRGDAGTANDEQAKPVRYEYGLPIDSFRVDTGIVADGQTLGAILNHLGATHAQINKVGLLT